MRLAGENFKNLLLYRLCAFRKAQMNCVSVVLIKTFENFSAKFFSPVIFLSSLPFSCFLLVGALVPCVVGKWTRIKTRAYLARQRAVVNANPPSHFFVCFLIHEALLRVTLSSKQFVTCYPGGCVLIDFSPHPND